MNNDEIQILNEIRFGYIADYKVAAMGEPWALKLKSTYKVLKKLGIDAILTLTEDDLYGKSHKKAGFLHHHEPIDDCMPPSESGMDRAIGFINTCVGKKNAVAVHCLEGRGRTGTVIAAWLAKKELLNAEDAIKRMYELRIHTVITPSQREFLRQYL